MLINYLSNEKYKTNKLKKKKKGYGQESSNALNLLHPQQDSKQERDRGRVKVIKICLPTQNPCYPGRPYLVFRQWLNSFLVH